MEFIIDNYDKIWRQSNTDKIACFVTISDYPWEAIRAKLMFILWRYPSPYAFADHTIRRVLSYSFRRPWRRFMRQLISYGSTPELREYSLNQMQERFDLFNNLNYYVTHDIHDIVEKAYMFVDHFKFFWVAEAEDEYYFTLQEKHKIEPFEEDKILTLEEFIIWCYETSTIEGQLEKREDIIDNYTRYLRPMGLASQSQIDLNKYKEQVWNIVENFFHLTEA